MDTNKLKPILIVVGVILLTPLLELIPSYSPWLGWKIFIQILVGLGLTIMLFLSREAYSQGYEKTVKRFSGDGDTSAHEFNLWKTLGFHLAVIVLMIWLWGPVLGSVFTAFTGNQQSSIFSALSVMVAGGIVYLVLLTLFLKIFKSRREKDDYPFLLRPREKSLLIYIGMLILIFLLALILKKAFNASVLSVFSSILITTAIFILISPLAILARLFIFYKARWIRNYEEFFGMESAERIKTFCKEKKIRPPFFYILEDEAPLDAYTFGYGPFLAFVVVARGMKSALTTVELESVVMHELGHIGHWDFSAAAVPATVLTSIFEVFTQAGSSLNSSSPLTNNIIFFSIAIINISIILVQQYLTRTREYYADEFSARGTGEPDALATGLAKITYGLAGSYYRPPVPAEEVKKSMLWDMKNPWSRITEFLSTHPTTANRGRYMAVLGQELKGGSQFSFQMEPLHRYIHFILDVFFNWGFSLSLIFSLILLLNIQQAGTGILFLIAGGFLLIATMYKYPFLLFKFQERKARTLSQDEKASPVRGMPVTVEGKIIGKRNPGARLSANPVIEDETGFVAGDYNLADPELLPVNLGGWGNYLNPLLLYHFYLGIFKMPEWLSSPSAKIQGWFRRGGSMGYLEIFKIQFPDGKTYRSYTVYLLLLWSLLILFLGLLKFFIIG